jgi:hypothetical protein
VAADPISIELYHHVAMHVDPLSGMDSGVTQRTNQEISSMCIDNVVEISPFVQCVTETFTKSFQIFTIAYTCDITTTHQIS